MKSSPEKLPKEEIEYIKSQSEYDKRILAAFAARRIGWGGISTVSKLVGISCQEGKNERDFFWKDKLREKGFPEEEIENMMK